MESDYIAAKIPDMFTTWSISFANPDMRTFKPL